MTENYEDVQETLVDTPTSQFERPQTDKIIVKFDD